MLLVGPNLALAGPPQPARQEAGFKLLGDLVLLLDKAGRGGLDDGALGAGILDLSKALAAARDTQRVDPIFAVRYSRLLSAIRQAVLRDPDLLYWPMYRSSMIAFIEERTGRLPDWDKLRFVVNDHGGSGVGLAMLVEAVMGEVVSLHLHLETLDRRADVLRGYLERSAK